MSESRVQTAESACADLLPNGGIPGEGQTLTAADGADCLEAVACIRSHGFPEFPDPTFRTTYVTFNVPSSIDKSSPRFKRALRSCRKLIPAGLPGDTPGTP